MRIFAISDLHLAISVNKPMDIFGDRWTNYMERLKNEWSNLVDDNDCVVIPGDISWGTYVEDTIEDFKFLDNLPGKKIISKGNHDYWWTTANKLEKFKQGNMLNSIEFMHNNSFSMDKIVLCGTRGWQCPGDEEFSKEDMKIYQRELQRLELSLKSAQNKAKDEIWVAMHYPPFNSQKQPSEFVEIMKANGVTKCIYGHLHGYSFKNAVQGVVEGVDFSLVSADYLNFKPLRLL